MLKKTITYEDWNGETRTEDFYFNLTRAELIEMETGMVPGRSLTDTLQTLITDKDMGMIVQTIKEIVLKAYGEKSADGKRFVKNQDVRDSFEQNPAYDILYMELAQDAEKAADFLNGIMPTQVTDALGDDPKKALMTKMREFEESKQRQ